MDRQDEIRMGELETSPPLRHPPPEGSVLPERSKVGTRTARKRAPVHSLLTLIEVSGSVGLPDLMVSLKVVPGRLDHTLHINAQIPPHLRTKTILVSLCSCCY